MKKWVAVFVMLLCLTLTMVALGDDDGFEIDFAHNLNKYTGTESDIIIPDGTHEIRTGAFSSMSVQKITVPNTVYRIADISVYCPNLTDVTILRQNVYIEEHAFISSQKITFYGYDNSSVQTYAQEHNLNFVSLGTAPDEDPMPTIFFEKDQYDFTVYRNGNDSFHYYFNIEDVYFDIYRHELKWFSQTPLQWSIDVPEYLSSYVYVESSDEDLTNWCYLYADAAAPSGDYICNLICSWEGQTATTTISLHFTETESVLRGIEGIDDIYTLKIGEQLNLTIQTNPIDWKPANEMIDYYYYCSVSGQSENGRDGIYGEFEPYFTRQETNENELLLVAQRSGYYSVSCTIQCANFSAYKEFQIIVLESDGSEPNKDYKEIRMNQNRIEAVIGKPYVLSFQQLSGSPMTWDDFDIYTNSDWEDYTTYTRYATPTDLIPGPYMECVTTKPGYYGLEFSYNDDYLGYISNHIIICVTDEEGNTPPLDDIEIYANLTKKAVIGESVFPAFTWWHTVYPYTYQTDVYFNNKLIDSMEMYNYHNIILKQIGEYSIVITVKDALGRTASKTAIITVTEPSPLKNVSYKILKIKENSTGGYDVFTEVSFEGGMAAVTARYIIYAKNRSNEWYQTWDEDTIDFSKYHWIGEDGEHKIEVILSDGVSEISATTEVFTVGEVPDYVFESSFKLPSGLKEIEAEAFARDTSITSVVCPTGLISIGKDAFKGCSGLKAIYIPETVETIEGNPFTSSQLVIYGRNTTCEAYRFAVQYGYQFIKTYGMQ